jgi:membrane protein implicated in regulation of membrane protease activity
MVKRFKANLKGVLAKEDGVALLIVIILLLLSGLIALLSGALFTIHPWLIAPVVLIVIAVCILIVVAVRRERPLQVNTGREGLVGQTAVVRAPLEPKGTVFIEGETWNARLDTGRAERGEEVIVTRVERLQLKVVKKSKEEV